MTPHLGRETRYLAMQREWYEQATHKAKVQLGSIGQDDVVGSWEKHNDHPDYENYLFSWAFQRKFITALDFGCGPGRNIQRWGYLFQLIDGVDISPKNLQNCRILLEESSKTNLFLFNGNDLGGTPLNFYDFIFSSICLQHIASHKVRFNIYQHMYSCLKPQGRISIQMSFGNSRITHRSLWNEPRSVGYYDNYFQALETNGRCDTRVENPNYLKNDLLSIGFKDFKYWIRPPGPGEINHENWIYFSAIKL